MRKRLFRLVKKRVVWLVVVGAVALIPTLRWVKTQPVPVTPQSRQQRSFSIPGDHLRHDSMTTVVKYLYGRYRLLGELDHGDLLRHEVVASVCGEELERCFAAVKRKRPSPRTEHLIGGSDQLAAFLLLYPGQPCEYRARADDMPMTLEALRQTGLPGSNVDALAVEYCRLKGDCYLAMVSPKAYHERHEVANAIADIGQVVYEKSIRLEGYGPYNYVKVTYGVFSHAIQAWIDDEAAVAGQIAKRFTTDNPLHIILFEAKSWNDVIEWKRAERKKLRMGTAALHITDTHDECVSLAEIFLSDDNVARLNNGPLDP